MTKSDFHLIVTALNEADVSFLLVGGLAVVEHGYGRNTFAVDLVVRLTPDSVVRAFAALARIGYQPKVPITPEEFAHPEKRRHLIEEKGMKVLNFWSDQHRETPLDIFVTEPFDFMSEYRQSEEREVAPGVVVRVVSLQTLFAMKREANRPKDLADLDELSLLHGLPSSYDDPERS
ncbi:MAG: hypothetical protein M3Y86_09860 [Verrucomicrobiota bacterium]|nr:hypothetical protein [Verrucomicrobiota bacterium]